MDFLIDNLFPSAEVNELIEFVDQNNIFEKPVIITGYKNNKKISFLKKFFTKTQKNPKKIFSLVIRHILCKIIYKIELKRVKINFPKYSIKYPIKNLNTTRL